MVTRKIRPLEQRCFKGLFLCKKIDSVKEKRSTKDAIKTERMEQMKELEKTYNPADIEDRLYRKWEDKKYFHAEVDRSKKPFTIVMPPPNVTGQLHMGHALDNTMQDILIRFKRMQGYSASPITVSLTNTVIFCTLFPSSDEAFVEMSVPVLLFATSERERWPMPSPSFPMSVISIVYILFFLSSIK